MILLNVENHQLINDKDNDLSNSALIIETISALRETFAGLGFNLYDHTQLFNTLHLFDRTNIRLYLKLTGYLIKNMLMQVTTKKGRQVRIMFI